MHVKFSGTLPGTALHITGDCCRKSRVDGFKLHEPILWALTSSSRHILCFSLPLPVKVTWIMATTSMGNTKSSDTCMCPLNYTVGVCLTIVLLFLVTGKYIYHNTDSELVDSCSWIVVFMCSWPRCCGFSLIQDIMHNLALGTMNTSRWLTTLLWQSVVLSMGCGFPS